MGILEDKFGVPPLSVLDVDRGYWRVRKNEWLALGIKSEIGRDVASIKNTDWLTSMGKGDEGTSMAIKASVFDPVLCELSYKWFCVSNGTILDPFAGGSVRGIVAGKLGYDYTGIDIREEQLRANMQNYNEIDNIPNAVKWVLGDSENVQKLTSYEKTDMIFSCPPYHDLETYSNMPEDLSNLKYNDFLIKYNKIIKESVSLLKNNRFAVFVVGEIRDEKGFYKNFVGETINAFLKAGMKFYNEIILKTANGSVTLRVDGQFTPYRKIGKTHQNILVFYKGDPEAIPSLNYSQFFNPLSEITCDKITLDDNNLIAKQDVVMCDVCGVKSKSEDEHNKHLTRPFHLNCIELDV